MNLKARSWFAGIAFASALALAACGGGGGNTGGGGGGGGNAALNVSTAGEQLQFAPANLSAAAGDVKVTFKNGSSAQKHNWVLVKGGDDVAQKVDEAGVAAGEAKGYIPDDPNIVAHTKLVNGGETDSASGNLAAGTYTFLCTFPGHYAAGMKGTLTVK
jgi:azurin